MPSVMLTSAEVFLYINGLPFGRVGHFSYSVDTPRHKIHTVDSSIPFELAQGPSNVTGTMGVYRTHVDGAAEGVGMVATLQELPREKYFTMLLVDLVTHAVIFQANYCAVESQSWSFDSKSLVTGNVVFSALTYNNEVRPLG